VRRWESKKVKRRRCARDKSNVQGSRFNEKIVQGLTFKVQRREKRIFTPSSEGHEEEKIKDR